MPKIDFEKIRQKVRQGEYEISIHAGKRLRSRKISLVECPRSQIAHSASVKKAQFVTVKGIELKQVLISGEIIERNIHAKPYPKCIFLGYIAPKGEALHVVYSITPEASVVTVYFPDEDRWAQDKIRKK